MASLLDSAVIALQFVLTIGLAWGACLAFRHRAPVETDFRGDMAAVVGTLLIVLPGGALAADALNDSLPERPAASQQVPKM